VIDRYVTDIKNGSWDLNGESIKISVAGFLNDGQHRCHAVVLAGIPIKTLIIFGCERESRLTLDQGAIRSTGDYLGMDGVESSNVAAAAARLVCEYRNGGKLSLNRSARPTKAQVIEAFRSNPGLSDSIRFAGKNGVGVIGGKSLIAFCHYILSEIDPAVASNFILKLIVGDELSTKDPIFLCRKRLLADKRLLQSEKVELIFRAWNAHRRNRFISKIEICGTLPKIGG
jgi:hypothetical protein